MKTIEGEILNVLSYFDLFDYPPTLEEIYTFFKKKTAVGQITRILGKMGKRGVILKIRLAHNSRFRYTLGEYLKKKIKDQRLKTKDFEEREKISMEKRKKIRLFIKLLSFFPQVKLIGLSGTVAMMNAKRDDDIDLFIITAKNRLFTGRFIALLIAQLLGIRRGTGSSIKFLPRVNSPSSLRSEPFVPSSSSESEVSVCHSLAQTTDSRKNFVSTSFNRDKVCLNLFFDEKNLSVPDFKKTEYVAHEILQMKPLIGRENVYNRFLRANSWAYEIFPNARDIIEVSPNRQTILVNSNPLMEIFESFVKKWQLIFINRHRTSEIITDTQLWFHPDDFEKKIGVISKNRR